MKQTFFKQMMMAGAVVVLMGSCKDDDPVIPVIPPSDGQKVQLNGIAGNETGANAANSVFVGFSNDNVKAVLRNSWDLKFFNGDQFRVKINNTTGASAIAVDKTDLNDVTINDLDSARVLEISMTAPKAEGINLVDNPITYGVGETVIGAVAENDDANKVYILNPVGASHAAAINEDNFWKVRILRNANRYTLQYAKLSEVTFKTLEIAKNTEFNYQFVSLTSGATVEVEPRKAEWDITWTWSLYHTDFSGITVPYSFSDLVFINSLGGVQAAEVLTETVSYENYAQANVASTSFSSAYDVIGSKWRSTAPPNPPSVRTDRFYVIKDAAGNVYKLKFVSFAAGDGGERGKPEIEYALVK